jgi:hypothetical protein
VADPALIRHLDVGQAAYIYRGGVTFVQVKRLIAAPAALAAARRPARGPGPGVAASGAAAPPAGTARPPAAARPPGAAPGGRRSGPHPAGPEPADAEAAALLDEAFGAEPT